MKKTIIFVMVFLIAGLSNTFFAKDMYDSEKLIIGKWIDEKNVEMEFKKDNKIIYFGKDEGTYKFLESKSILMIKFRNNSTKYRVKFEDENTLVLTEIKRNKKKGPQSLLKRMVE